MAQKNLSYQGGQLITNVKVFVIYWGDDWTQSLAPLCTSLNQFFTTILTSPLIDQLAEYNAGQYQIGYGSFIGSTQIPTGTMGARLMDADIRQQLQSLIANNTLPAPDANTLYFFYLPSGVQVVDGTDQSCTQFCGYHDATPDPIFYAVMPYPSCDGCLDTLSVLDALTGTSSHELCEAITDPIPGSGWIDTGNGNAEIGDLCAWNFKQVSGFNVQLEWSNQQNNCI